MTTLTLQRWRDARKGPAVTLGILGGVWHAIDGSNVIRYRRNDVMEWLDATRLP